MALARALAADPELLILDEPTAALDRAGARAVARLLAGLDDRVTILATTHDPALIEAASDRLDLVDDRRERAPRADLRVRAPRPLSGSAARASSERRHATGSPSPIAVSHRPGPLVKTWAGSVNRNAPRPSSSNTRQPRPIQPTIASRAYASQRSIGVGRSPTA